MNFDFLKTTTLQSVETNNQVKKAGKTAMVRVPDNGASLRLFKDGSIYPSKELVEKYNLEYNESMDGNGFDVFYSLHWGQYPKDAAHVVFISAVPKKEARVDLFSNAKKVDGNLTSVLEQGSSTFGKELIKMLEEAYHETLFTNSKYVDLMIIEDVSIPSNDGIYFIPKQVAKGENKGSMTTVRRENISIHPLALFSNNESSEIINEEELVEENIG